MRSTVGNVLTDVRSLVGEEVLAAEPFKPGTATTSGAWLPALVRWAGRRAQRPPWLPASFLLVVGPQTIAIVDARFRGGRWHLDELVRHWDHDTVVVTPVANPWA